MSNNSKQRGWQDRYDDLMRDRENWPEWMKQWRRNNPIGSVYPPEHVGICAACNHRETVHDGEGCRVRFCGCSAFEITSEHAAGEFARRAGGFPILDGDDIPWSAIAPHEDIAKANHGGQDLEHLASRGGLSVKEAIHVIERRHWRGPESDAIAQLSDDAAADRLRGLLSGRARSEESE